MPIKLRSRSGPVVQLEDRERSIRSVTIAALPYSHADLDSPPKASGRDSYQLAEEACKVALIGEPCEQSNICDRMVGLCQ